MRALVLAVAVLAAPALAEPVRYTIDTKTGLTSRSTENGLYNAVWRLVGPVAKAMGLSTEETECAKATAAQRLLEVARDALQGALFDPLGGLSEAERFFRRGQDDWCNKAGGMKGAEAMKPSLERAQSFIRPFLSERFQELKDAQSRPLTPAEVAAVIAAALVALPVLAPL